MKVTVDTGKSRDAVYVILASVVTCQLEMLPSHETLQQETPLYYIRFYSLTPLQNPVFGCDFKDPVKLS